MKMKLMAMLMKTKSTKVCVLGEEAGGFLTVALGLLLAEKRESNMVIWLLKESRMIAKISQQIVAIFGHGMTFMSI